MRVFCRSIFRKIRLIVLTGLCALMVWPAGAAELKLEARLIWGTNDGNFRDPKYKPVDQATAEKFRKIFQWKHYYEITRREVIVPSRSTRKIPMSGKCTIEITELQGPKVGVTLIGEGKPVNRTTKDLTKGESFTLAGDLRDGSAWFVMITELDEK